MNKKIPALLGVLVLAYCARAGTVITNTGFATGTSLEYREAGEFIVSRGDRGEIHENRYWMSDTENFAKTVSVYAVGAAYDYAARGQVRASAVADENDGTNSHYLVFADAPLLSRTIMPIENAGTPQAIVSNVLVSSAAVTNGIYADTLAQFSVSIAPPAVTEDDRVVLWLRETVDATGAYATNLIVTAGRYDSGFTGVAANHYVIASPVVKVGTWHRVTIRAIADVTESSIKAPCFTVYVDGVPAVADGAYDLGLTTANLGRLTPAARVLAQERRLFPWLTRPGSDRSMTLSRFTFTGSGALDDVTFATVRPTHVTDDHVFTLNWDAGLTSLKYVVTAGDGTSFTNTVADPSASPRYCDFSLGTNGEATVVVTCAFDTEHDYSNGVWRAENGCTVESNVFTYASVADYNPIGYIGTTRNCVGIGGSGYSTFAEAKAVLKARGTSKTIVLEEDVTVSTAYAKPYRDQGFVPVTTGDDLILDLNGHTLQGASPMFATIHQNAGSLQIIDSSADKTGRVLPPANMRGTKMAVKSMGTRKYGIPTLVIDAGWYDGLVCVTGETAEIIAKMDLTGTCAIHGGHFKSDDGDVFYLERYVTDPKQYFSYEEPYWETTASGYIWTGKGEDTRWILPENWKCGEAPGPGDLAIFPKVRVPDGGWPVDFGLGGTTTTNLWVDGDICMAGTNDFTCVRTADHGDGRFVGTGTAIFTGVLPGKLTATTQSRPEIRLGSAWQGTVRIRKITYPSLLTNIGYWGLAASTVEFNGVRGYLRDRTNRTLAYTLKLTDDDATPAWKNETGSTTSTIVFPRLLGTGTFESSKSAATIKQVFQFRNVANFRGKFTMLGKRLVLGVGDVMSSVGSVSFGNGVLVRSGLGWSGVAAKFGSTLNVYGHSGDILYTYSGATAPSVSGVTVNLTDPESGEVLTGELVLSNKTVVVRMGAVMTMNGLMVQPATLAASVKSGDSFTIPAGSAVTIVGNDVYVNGSRVTSVASYYSVVASPTQSGTFTVELNEEVVEPDIGSEDTAYADGEMNVGVSNTFAGLWYGLEYTPNLATAWSVVPDSWVQATADGQSIVFSQQTDGSGGFYRVVVSDNPNASSTSSAEGGDGE